MLCRWRLVQQPRKRSRYVLIFEKGMAPLHVWKQERSGFDFVFGWRNVSEANLALFNTVKHLATVLQCPERVPRALARRHPLLLVGALPDAMRSH
jgi:hypothetical protein